MTYFDWTGWSWPVVGTACTTCPAKCPACGSQSIRHHPNTKTLHVCSDCGKYIGNRADDDTQPMATGEPFSDQKLLDTAREIVYDLSKQHDRDKQIQSVLASIRKLVGK
jgi:ribosomal protein L32